MVDCSKQQFVFWSSSVECAQNAPNLKVEFVPFNVQSSVLVERFVDKIMRKLVLGSAHCFTYQSFHFRFLYRCLNTFFIK
mmetsp:Transcript_110898/g.309906  ORF Transcript_110898/g.309906 Transcript_110898/m.309906 type:complete len:80 (+) Transcript_110898:56-295(+)